PFLAARPNDGGALTNYGIALANTGKPGEAVDAFRRAVSVNASDLIARRNLASGLFNLGRMDDAAAEAHALLRVEQSDALAHDLLGRVFGSGGKLAEARAEFERALDIDPHYEQAREDLEMLRRATGTNR